VTPSVIPDDGTEAYGEYYGDVINAVVKLNDPRSITALVGAINTGNMAMNAIANFGTSALSQVIQQLSGSNPTMRSSAALTIGKMIGANLVSDPSSRAAIGSALETASSDPDYYVAVSGANSMLKLFQSQLAVSPIPPTQISTTASGLVYSRVSQTFTGTVTINNVSGNAINGPFQIVFASLPGGVTLVNATNAFNGMPYITVPAVGTLAPGQAFSINVQFKNPLNAKISFTPTIYSGSIN
jgi:hypothetical protein